MSNTRKTHRPKPKAQPKDSMEALDNYYAYKNGDALHEMTDEEQQYADALHRIFCQMDADEQRKREKRMDEELSVTCNTNLIKRAIDYAGTEIEVFDAANDRHRCSLTATRVIGTRAALNALADAIKENASDNIYARALSAEKPIPDSWVSRWIRAAYELADQLHQA